MKFNIARRPWVGSMRFATSIAKTGSVANDIFDLVSVKLTGKKLDVRGGNGAMEINAPVDVEGEAEEGHVMFNGKKVLAYCETLDEGGDEKEAAGIDVEVKDGFLTIRVPGKRSKQTTKVQTGDYPTLDTGSPDSVTADLSIPADKIMRLINKTSFLIPREAGHRPALQGMLMELRPDGVLRGVTTDAQCLALCDVPLPEYKAEERKQFVIPRDTLERMKDLLQNADKDTAVNLKLSEGALELAVDSKTTVASKLIDAKFPDYERVIDKNFDKNLVVSKETLRQAIRRADTVFDHSHLGPKGCTFKLKENVLNLYSKNSEGEDVEEELDVRSDGEEISLMLNTDFVMRGVAMFDDDELKLLFIGPKEGVQMMSGSGDLDLLYVMMPLSP